MPYKVLVNDLTVNADGPEITDMFGNVIGRQTTSAIYQAGQVLDDEQVSEAMRESVENGDTEGYLEKAGDGEETPVLAPIPGYEELSVEQVQSLFTLLPSDAIRAVMDYEANYGENRLGIVDYHIGRGEAYTGRLAGQVGGPLQESADKPLSGIVTRDVTEDGQVRFGESINDDGTPQMEPYTLEGDDRYENEKIGSNEDAPSPVAAPAEPKAPKGRRGRRASAAASGATKAEAEARSAQSAQDQGTGDSDRQENPDKGDGDGNS